MATAGEKWLGGFDDHKGERALWVDHVHSHWGLVRTILNKCIRF